MTYAANLAMELAAKAASAGSARATPTTPAPPASMPRCRPAQGMVGIYAAVSTANHMAPWGGAEPLIGTNPIAIGIPAGKEAPVMLDIATSVSSFGAIRQHLVSGNRWRKAGWSTARPASRSSIRRRSRKACCCRSAATRARPRADHRPARGRPERRSFGRDVVDSPRPGTEKTNTGQFVVALDVSRFIEPRRSRPKWTAISASCDRQALPGVDTIRMPGEDRRKRRAERTANGVALPPTLMKQLDDLAAELKIKPLGGR